MPTPCLANVPVPVMAADTVSESVKLATIAPSLTMVGVTIEPASPPVPRLSVLPVPIRRSTADTDPPSAMVRVPTRIPLVLPIRSDPATASDDLVPVTVASELKSISSPIRAVPLTVTVPPPATKRMPGPPGSVPLPTSRSPVMAQVESVPVTVACGAPGKIEVISAPNRLFNRPPPLISSVPAAKMPMPVRPLTVTVEPAPVMTAAPETVRSELMSAVGPMVSTPPLVTVNVPDSTLTPMKRPTTVSAVPSIVRPPVGPQLHSTRSPPIVPDEPAVPVSVRWLPLLRVRSPLPAKVPEKVVATAP